MTYYGWNVLRLKFESNPHALGNMPKRVTSNGAHIRGLPEQRSFEGISLSWLGLDDTVSDLTGPEPKTSRAVAMSLTTTHCTQAGQFYARRFDI